MEIKSKILDKMKQVYFAVLILFLPLSFLAENIYTQRTVTVILARSNLRNFTLSDLPAEAQAIYKDLQKRRLLARSELINQMLSEELLKMEANAKATSIDDLVTQTQKSSKVPTESEIRNFFDQNKSKIGDVEFEEVKGEIRNLLMRRNSDEALSQFLKSLAVKFKAGLLIDPMSAVIKTNQPIFRIGSKTYTYSQFLNKYNPLLNDAECADYEFIRDEIENTVFNALVENEAKLRGMDTGELIAEEVTNKLRTFTPGEREALEARLFRSLFAKYAVKITLTAPKPIVRNISLDLAASRGSGTAPVTVVMFSDFQCPACAATSPILESIINIFGENNVRLAVKNFPLTKIHPLSMEAAIAARAAFNQGRFFDYIHLIYSNQADLSFEDFRKFASDIGLDINRFEADRRRPETTAAVQSDITEAKALNVNVTPTIFVNGVKLQQLSAQAFRRAIEDALQARQTINKKMNQ
jgi:protein-disulfide isomerase